MKEHLCVKCLSETCPNAGYDTSIAKCAVYIPPKPKTNADRIRAMNNRELAKVLHDAGCNWYSEKYWLELLEREVEEDDKKGFVVENYKESKGAERGNIIGPCPLPCLNKTDFGYCRNTGCINLKYNPITTVTITDKKTYDAIRMLQDPEYGIGNNA